MRKNENLSLYFSQQRLKRNKTSINVFGRTRSGSETMAKTVLRYVYIVVSKSRCVCPYWYFLIFFKHHYYNRTVISSPEPSGSKGEVIIHPCSGVRRRRRHPAISSETAWPIRAIFHVKQPLKRGTKFYINGPGHMIKMAVTPIYGKRLLKIIFSRIGGAIVLKLGMQHR